MASPLIRQHAAELGRGGVQGGGQQRKVVAVGAPAGDAQCDVVVLGGHRAFQAALSPACRRRLGAAPSPAGQPSPLLPGAPAPRRNAAAGQLLISQTTIKAHLLHTGTKPAAPDRASAVATAGKRRLASWQEHPAHPAPPADLYSPPFPGITGRSARRPCKTITLLTDTYSASRAVSGPESDHSV
jgi:hypothetical protein